MITTYLNQKKSNYLNFIETLSAENIFSSFLSIFRVYIAFHIIKSVYLSWDFISVFQKDISIVKHSFPKPLAWVLDYLIGIHFFNVPLFIYLLIFFSINLLFGYLKNLNFVFLFLFFKIYMSYNLEISIGGYNYMYLILLFMCFTNSWKHFSFVNYKETTNTNLLSNIAVYSIMIQLCLIYLISALNKVHAEAWFNGSATYYILSTIPYCSPIAAAFKDNTIFAITSTYFTLFFELFFWILIWLKPTRKLMIISGIALHLSIYLFMMLYDFEILFIFVYGFFIANEFWSKKIVELKRLKMFKFLEPKIQL